MFMCMLNLCQSKRSPQLKSLLNSLMLFLTFSGILKDIKVLLRHEQIFLEEI